MKKQELKRSFEFILKVNGIDLDKTEYMFHATRKWRSDYAWPDKNLLVELEGGVFTQGRHTRSMGFIGDCDKYNAAALDGWTILRYTVEHINKRPAVVAEQILEALHDKETEEVHKC